MVAQSRAVPAAPLAPPPPGSALARFWGEQSGTLTIFGLMFLILMIMMGGIAVDLMRYESKRTALQNTLDRATLAAASLTQDRDAETVVRDYFRKAGMTDELRSITVTQGLNFRNVEADADVETNPAFMHLMGISSMDAYGLSQAEQRINNVEIMLVLDVSGSMASNSKLTNLKNAANAFVSSVLTNDVEHKVSIGIVPFNGQVNLGPTLKSYFTLTDANGTTGVDCVDLPASAYVSYAIPRDLALSMTANADTYSGSSATAPAETNKWCPTVNTAVSPTVYYTGNPAGSGGNIVRMPQQDIATLQGYVNGLVAVGATSINAGMKWGMTLLDPSMQGVYQSYMDAGLMPATMTQRPLAYDHEDAMKVIVLMTDGEHFAEERVNSTGSTNYKSGTSPIWKANDGRYSIFHASKVDSSTATTLCNSRPFWVVHLSAWQSRPWNGTAPANTDCYQPSPSPAYTLTTAQTWPQVWAALRVAYVAQYMYANAVGGSASSWLATFRTQTATTTMDSQLQTACAAAKAQKVIIYGIAFEAPSNGQTQIRQCSTDPDSGSHYFDATGIQISTAFAAIANNISQLRLLQ